MNVSVGKSRVKNKKNSKERQLPPMSAFANCILMMMKTNEWYDKKKGKNIYRSIASQSPYMQIRVKLFCCP